MVNFAPFDVGVRPNTFRLVAAGQDLQLFGFQKDGEFYRTLRLADNGWDDLACQVLSNPLTAERAPHLYMKELWCYENPNGNLQAVKTMRTALEEQIGAFGSPLPEARRSEIFHKQAYSIGDVVFHPSTVERAPATYNGYRLKMKQRDRVLLISWELLCEFCALWLRDKRTAKYRPDIATEWLITRPTEHFNGVSLCSDAPPMVRVERVVQSSLATKQKAAVDPLTTLAEAKALAKRLLGICLGLPAENGSKLRFIISTIDPALSGLIQSLEELGAPERPVVDNSEERKELDRRTEELAERDVQLRKFRANLNSQVIALFGEEEARLVTEAARVEAAAAELDRQAATLADQRRLLEEEKTEHRRQSELLRQQALQLQKACEVFAR